MLISLIQNARRRRGAAMFLKQRVGETISPTRATQLATLTGRKFDAATLRKALSRFPETRDLM